MSLNNSAIGFRADDVMRCLFRCGMRWAIWLLGLSAFVGTANSVAVFAASISDRGTEVARYGPGLPLH